MLKIVSTHPDYAVEDSGRVFSSFGRNGRRLKTGELRQLSPGKNSRGYLCVALKGESHLVHRLVVVAFIGPIGSGLQVNHKDGNKENNAVGNLEIVTPQENVRHAQRTGLNQLHGMGNANAKLTPQVIQEVHAMAKRGASGQKIADWISRTYMVSVTAGYINQVVRGLYRSSYMEELERCQ